MIISRVNIVHCVNYHITEQWNEDVLVSSVTWLQMLKSFIFKCDSDNLVRKTIPLC